MKRYTIATGAGVLLSAASVFVFYGLNARRDLCVNLVKEPFNIGLQKEVVREYRKSGAWETAIICEVEKAKEKLLRYKPARGEKPAVVFDIDDTALSNWEFINISDFCYHRGGYENWENSAQDPAIGSIKELYDIAKEKGFALFFITGRRENQRAPTERNLRAVGYTHFDGIYFKPMDFKGASVAEFKSKVRAEIMQLGYTLVLNIGDQQSDLDGEPQAQYNIKIANPAYFVR